MRIIFVGLHNKPGMKPLDSKTKSGKLIDRIIQLISEGHEVIKSNLFDVDYFPPSDDYRVLINQWLYKHNPDTNTIFILLGQFVHNHFPFCCNLIRIAHPASKRSHRDMDEYVLNAVNKISNCLNIKNHDTIKIEG
jgi:hypothetical protein